MDPAHVVRQLFERMQERDWPAAAAVIAPDARIRFSHTGEQFSGAGFVAMNEAYPEGWQLEIVDLMASGTRVAVQVRVPHGDQIDWLSGFYTVSGDVIIDGTEHWVTEAGEPPPSWRRTFTSS